MRKRPRSLRLASLVALTLVVVLAPALMQVATRPAAAAASPSSVEVVLLAQGTAYETPLYIIHGTDPGPVAMVVGGVNGAQPAGVEAAEVASTYRIRNGTLLVLPAANKQAVDTDAPWVSGEINLQAAFPTSSTGAPNGALATAIWNTVKQYRVQYLVDIHESPTYYVTGSSTMGQTVGYQPTPGGTALATAVTQALNSTASHQFSMAKNMPLRSLPRAASDYLGVTSLLVRTTTSEPMAQRAGYAVAAVNAMLQSGGMDFNRVSVAPVADGTKYETNLYVFDSFVPGPTFMIVGGVHGNEPAGYGAALQFNDEVMIKKGKLLVLPQANILGDNKLSRYIEGTTDLNRLFPDTTGEVPTHPLALAIWSVVKENKVDYLVDFHEGYDYASNPKNTAVGQTFIYYPAAAMQDLATRTVADLNTRILDPYKRFKTLKYPVPGSLARAAGQYLGVKAGIIETVYPEPYAQRVSYHIQAMNFMLRTLGIK